MTNTELYQKLIKDIAEAKAERDKLYKSLYDDSQPGGGWITAVKTECGAPYSSSNTFADYPKGSKACFDALSIVGPRLKTIATNDSNIIKWQAQADGLLKDPIVGEELKNKKLNTGIKIAIIIIIIIAISIWAWKKYKK